MERGTEKFIIQGTQCYFSQLKCCGHSGAGVITSGYFVCLWWERGRSRGSNEGIKEDFVPDNL